MRYLYYKRMCTDQEALRTKKERGHSYDGIGRARLYALLRKAVRSYTDERGKDVPVERYLRYVNVVSVTRVVRKEEKP